MSETPKLDNITNDIQQGEAAYAQTQAFIDSHKEQFASANQLWKQYGKPKNIPFTNWLNDEVMKAKSTGAYREGMKIDEIVKANRAGSTVNPLANPQDDAKPTKSFQIGGLNGYAVLGVVVVILGIGIYLASGALFPTKKMAVIPLPVK